jgi:hypothetical protein
VNSISGLFMIRTSLQAINCGGKNKWRESWDMVMYIKFTMLQGKKKDIMDRI